MTQKILFVGAHHDDIEIAAGGTVSKLISFGDDVKWIILTDEEDCEKNIQRRGETIRAAEKSGVSQANVFFFAEQDGALRADRLTITKLREFTIDNDIDPDLIFVHTEKDSHNDHVDAFHLVKAAFRKKVILTYYVVNSGIQNSFRPEVFVNTSKFQNQKKHMLKAHASQDSSGRILYNEISKRDQKYADAVRDCYCEAFEVIIQEGCRGYVDKLSKINDCEFTSLWRQILGITQLTMIYGRVVSRVSKPGLPENRPVVDVDLQSRLTSLFSERYHFGSQSNGRPVVQSCQSTLYDDEAFFSNGSILLIGGTTSNNATLRIFNYLPSLRFEMGHEMPYYKKLFIYDRVKKKRIFAEYIVNEAGQKEVVRDIGLLTVLKNPYSENGLLVGAMGIHGGATRAVGRILCCDPETPQIHDLVAKVRSEEILGFQALISAENNGLTVKLNKRQIYQL